jgi:hypothetical protein
MGLRDDASESNRFASAERDLPEITALTMRYAPPILR